MIIQKLFADIQDELTAIANKFDDESHRAAVYGIIRKIRDASLWAALLTLGTDRQDIRVPTSILTKGEIDGQDFECAIVDLSLGGVFIASDVHLEQGRHVMVDVPEAGTFVGEVVHAHDGTFGLAFESSDPNKMLRLAKVINAFYD